MSVKLTSITNNEELDTSLPVTETLETLEARLQLLASLSLAELSETMKGFEARSWSRNIRFQDDVAYHARLIEFTEKSSHGVSETERATGFLGIIANIASVHAEHIDILLDLSECYGLDLEASLANCQNIQARHSARLTRTANQQNAKNQGEGDEILRNLGHNPATSELGLSMVALEAQHNADIMMEVLNNENATSRVHAYIPAELVREHFATQARQMVSLVKAEAEDPIWNTFDIGANVHTDFAAIYNSETPAWVLDELVNAPGIRGAVLNQLISDDYYSCHTGYENTNNDDDGWEF